MNRQIFLNNFNNYFNNKNNGFFNFSVYVKEYNNKLEFNEQFINKLSPFFINSNFNEYKKILSSINVNKEYDAYYEEDHPDSEFCCFQCKINLNKLYDDIISIENIESPLVNVYRIENKQGLGLYSSRFAAINVDIEKHPDPNFDINLNGVFSNERRNHDEKYQKEWIFGFSNILDAKNWLDDTNHINLLHKDGFFFKEITIPSAFVITGDRQLILKPEKQINEKILSLDTLLKKPKISF